MNEIRNEPKGLWRQTRDDCWPGVNACAQLALGRKATGGMALAVHDLHSKWKQKSNAKFDWSHHMRRIRNVLGHCNVQPTVR